MKLSQDEIFSLEQISAVSCLSNDKIKDIFRSILVTLVMKICANEYDSKKDKKKEGKIILPYLGELSINYDNNIVSNGNLLNLEGSLNPSSYLYQEIAAILNNEFPPTTQYHMKMFQEKIEKDLGIYNELD